MTRMMATAEVSAIGQIELNNSNRLVASSFNMLTVAKFVSTIVATAADTIGGPTLREYLNNLVSPERGGITTSWVNKLRIFAGIADRRPRAFQTGCSPPPASNARAGWADVRSSPDWGFRCGCAAKP